MVTFRLLFVITSEMLIESHQIFILCCLQTGYIIRNEEKPASLTKYCAVLQHNNYCMIQLIIDRLLGENCNSRHTSIRLVKLVQLALTSCNGCSVACLFYLLFEYNNNITLLLIVINIVIRFLPFLVSKNLCSLV